MGQQIQVVVRNWSIFFVRCHFLCLRCVLTPAGEVLWTGPNRWQNETFQEGASVSCRNCCQDAQWEAEHLHRFIKQQPHKRYRFVTPEPPANFCLRHHSGFKLSRYCCKANKEYLHIHNQDSSASIAVAWLKRTGVNYSSINTLTHCHSGDGHKIEKMANRSSKILNLHFPFSYLFVCSCCQLWAVEWFSFLFINDTQPLVIHAHCTA